MPRYEYVCRTCDATTERHVPLSERDTAEVACSRCGRTDQTVRRFTVAHIAPQAGIFNRVKAEIDENSRRRARRRQADIDGRPYTPDDLPVGRGGPPRKEVL